MSSNKTTLTVDQMILILISSSGVSAENKYSMNIVEVCDQVNLMNIKTISLIGKDGEF